MHFYFYFLFLIALKKSISPEEINNILKSSYGEGKFVSILRVYSIYFLLDKHLTYRTLKLNALAHISNKFKK